ncbi:MAG: hypothetical protein WA964_16675 [Ilumatobacter sp.]|uniref:hypothetical protein n=1 Tax=Ilumatobacter sp. TaxID=1967498 RepID=UPI003C708844
MSVSSCSTSTRWCGLTSITAAFVRLLRAFDDALTPLDDDVSSEYACSPPCGTGGTG